MSLQTHPSGIAPSFQLTGWNEWDSTIFLLRSSLLADKTAPFIDDGRQSIDWQGIDEEAGYWSSAEQMLVATARNLWTGDGAINLNALMTTLDRQNFELFRQALAIRRGDGLEVESRLSAFLEWLIDAWDMGQEVAARQAANKAAEFGLEGDVGGYRDGGAGSVRSVALWDCITPPVAGRSVMETHRLGIAIWGHFPGGDKFHPAFYRYDHALSSGG